MTDNEDDGRHLRAEGYRPQSPDRERPRKFIGGYQPSTSHQGKAPTGGSGASKPDK